MADPEHVARVLEYFGALAGLESEGAIEDHLLVSPRVDAATAGEARVQALLVQGLQAPSMAVRLFVLRICLVLPPPPAPLAPELLSLVLQTVGAPEAGLGAQAVRAAAHLASAARLAACGPLLDEIDARDDTRRLRLLELLVQLASADDELARLPLVQRRLDAVLQMAESDADPLSAMAALELFQADSVLNKRAVASGAIGRIGAQTRKAENSLLDGPRLRALGRMLAAGGMEAERQSGPLVEAALETIAKADEVRASYLDGQLGGVVCGLAAGSEAGRRRVVDSGLLAAILSLPETHSNKEIRLIAFHSLHSLLQTLEGADEATRGGYLAAFEAGGGNLVAKLLHYSEAPLMDSERATAMHLLAALVQHVPKWALKSNPTLVTWVVQRDTEADTILAHWRLEMATELKKSAAARGLLSKEQQESVDQYVRGGLYGPAESRADTASKAGQ